MADAVEIRRAVLDDLTAHARDEAPSECCGLLVGTKARIDEGVRTRNLDASPSRFRVDPSAHVALNRRLRGTARRVVGSYHSHPHSMAEPSPSDIAEAYYPDFLHVIVSLQDPEHPDVRAFRIADGNFSRAVLVPVP